jgi:hypothetical protein
VTMGTLVHGGVELREVSEVHAPGHREFNQANRSPTRGVRRGSPRSTVASPAEAGPVRDSKMAFGAPSDGLIVLTDEVGTVFSLAPSRSVSWTSERGPQRRVARTRRGYVVPPAALETAVVSSCCVES